MLLRNLQSLLGRLYDVSVDYDVYDFWSPAGARSRA